MDGPGGIKRSGPAERLMLAGLNQARTCRVVTYDLSRGGFIKFVLPRMKDLEKGGALDATIELGPDNGYSIQLKVTKSSLFRFDQEIATYNDILVKQRSAGKPAELLDDLQKYADALILLKQVMILLRLDEPGRKPSPQEMPIIDAILEDVTMRRHSLDMLMAREEMAYPFGLEAQMREKLGITP